MTLTDEQLKRFGKMILSCVREEFQNDKPFWHDDWPDDIARVIEYVHDEENMSEPPDWQDVQAAVSQLLDKLEKSL